MSGQQECGTGFQPVEDGMWHRFPTGAIERSLVERTTSATASDTMFVWLWYSVGTIATLVLGMYLVVHGWRGRRHGGEPRCRKCDYNLTLLDSEQCPECGTKLGRRTIAHGARRRSWVLVACGTMLLMLGLLSSQSTLLELGARRHALFPLRMLVDRAAGGDQRSMFEVERRIKKYELSEAQGHRLADRALGWVGSKPDVHDPWWRRLIDLD